MCNSKNSLLLTLDNKTQDIRRTNEVVLGGSGGYCKWNVFTEKEFRLEDVASKNVVIIPFEENDMKKYILLRSSDPLLLGETTVDLLHKLFKETIG